MGIDSVIAALGPAAAAVLSPLRLLDEVLSAGARDNARAAVEDARRRASARAALERLGRSAA